MGSARQKKTELFCQNFPKMAQKCFFLACFFEKFASGADNFSQNRHYEAKLCILGIVSGFHNRPKSDLSRNPQHCFIFFAILDSTNKYLNTGIHLHLRIPLTNFADSTYVWGFHLHFCGIHLQVRKSEQLAIFACCGIRGTTNVPTKFTLQVFVRRIQGSFLSGIRLHFGTCLQVCPWNPGTNRHKIVRLSSAQFGLVMGSLHYFRRVQEIKLVDLEKGLKKPPPLEMRT